jgi:hypothetical protein
MLLSGTIDVKGALLRSRRRRRDDAARLYRAKTRAPPLNWCFAFSSWQPVTHQCMLGRPAMGSSSTVLRSGRQGPPLPATDSPQAAGSGTPPAGPTSRTAPARPTKLVSTTGNPAPQRRPYPADRLPESDSGRRPALPMSERPGYCSYPIKAYRLISLDNYIYCDVRYTKLDLDN